MCDAFDAMTSDRVYRGEMTVDTALEELRRGAGSQFDPGIVEPFCAVFDGAIDQFAIGA